MLRFLTDGFRLRLTESKRSDAGLFNFYSKLALGGLWHSLPLKQQIEEARKEFGKPTHTPTFQLTVSHKHRMHIIKQAQLEELAIKRLSGAEVFWLPPVYSSCQNKTQELWLYVDKLLISIATIKGVYNSQMLKLTKLDTTSCDFEDFDTKKPITLSHAVIQKYCRSAACMTYASVQGRSFDDLGIWTKSPKFTSRHLFMALSRARSSNKIWVMD